MDRKELSNEDFVGYDGDAALFIGGYCSEIKQGANKKDREMSINSSFDIHALHNNYIVDFVL